LFISAINRDFEVETFPQIELLEENVSAKSAAYLKALFEKSGGPIQITFPSEEFWINNKLLVD